MKDALPLFIKKPIIFYRFQTSMHLFYKKKISYIKFIVKLPIPHSLPSGVGEKLRK